jgi:hypothetical protein
MMTIHVMLMAAAAMGFATAALFFVRFYKETSDPLFVMFAIAFALEALNRTVLGLNLAHQTEGAPIVYVIRLLGYGLILAAIVRKNISTRS